MIVDCVTYNGEKDLFDLRYNILKESVDEFLVLEFDKTFSGEIKSPSFPRSLFPEVKYYFVGEEVYEKYRKLAESSPNTNYGHGASHWVREFCQKESIKDFLSYLKDDDIVFIGDVDEVWNPANLPKIENSLRYHNTPQKFWAWRVYTYYINNLSSEEWNGTLIAFYGQIKNACLNHLRSKEETDSEFSIVGGHRGGWHFTSMGGPEALKKKLADSYTEESYATSEVVAHLEENYGKKDFLGRDFTYRIDESDWPQFLRENREKYLHLIKVDN